MSNEFGQEVLLTVTDSTGNKLVFDAAGLRIDFDVRIIDGFSRGTFTLYNLQETTIRVLANGENYVTLKTRLHGSQEYTIANRFFISNVLEEKKLPNSITTLYCYDLLRKQYLEEQINVTVKSPTLNKQMRQICTAAGFTGNITYKSFPDGRIHQQSARPQSVHQGTAQQCIRALQHTHGFKLYTDIDSGITCMYLPSLSEVALTTLESKASDIVLDITNMRANPKIGPATLFVTSNLDGRIRPTAILDTSKLVTVGVDVDEQTLQIANEFLKDTVAGFTKYQTLTVQHKGSNYTSEWKTIATATSPTEGKSMPTLSWQKGI